MNFDKTDRPRGIAVVLTADRTLMGYYPTLLDGMMATVQTTFVPSAIHRGILSPPLKADGPRCSIAPLGLRKLESVLIASGMDSSDIAVVRPCDLHKAIGPDTRVVGISSGDPLGLGMTGTTMVDMLGGELHTAKAMRQLCRSLQKLRAKKGYNFCTIAGGPGSWQLANNPEKSQQLGIDRVYMGYGESDAAKLFNNTAVSDTDAATPYVIESKDHVPAGKFKITGPASMGIVEISRGCGLGCDFCTLACEPMTHADIDTILHESRINLSAGSGAISLISEDLLRYGCEGGKIAPDKLFEMVSAVRQLDDLRMIQVDHINISSILQYSDTQLRELRELLRPAKSRGQELLWVNLGVESADGQVLCDSGMSAKMRPSDPQQWSKTCRNAIFRMEDAGFMPMVSLVMGLEGESPESVTKTLEFVRSLSGHNVTVFPIFLAPVDKNVTPFTRKDMSDQHWLLLKESYELNFRWIPQMFADNHAAAGVGAVRRNFIQIAGKFQTLVWRGKFALNCPRARD